MTIGDGRYEERVPPEYPPEFNLVEDGADLGADLKDEPPDRPPDLAARDSDGFARSAAPHSKAEIDLVRDGDRIFFQSTVFISSLFLSFITIDCTVGLLVVNEILVVKPLTVARSAIAIRRTICIIVYFRNFKLNKLFIVCGSLSCCT